MISGIQIADNTILNKHLLLTPPVVDSDPITKGSLDDTLSAITINGTPINSGDIVIDSDSIGLGNVDNTSDALKPISTATQSALDLKLPFGTVSYFKGLGANAPAQTFYVTDKSRIGLFNYDPTDTTSADNDGKSVIVIGNKRYKRDDSEDLGLINIKKWGIKGDGITNDQPALQILIDATVAKGRSITLPEGVYLLKDTLKFRKIGGNFYKSTLRGQGKGVTQLIAGPELAGKNLIEYINVTGDTNGRDVYIEITDMDIYNKYGLRAIYMNNVVNVLIRNCMIGGGTLGPLEIGDVGLNYAVFVRECYFNSSNFNDGQGEFLLKIRAAYHEITNCVGDGSRFGFWSDGDGCVISECNIEGTKNCGIRIESSGGGRARIVNNAIRPYAGYEPNGQFDGTMFGIRVVNPGGGAVSNNTITGNHLYIPATSDVGTVMILTNVTGTFTSNANGGVNRITGSISGASSGVWGYSSASKRIVPSVITGGPYVVGETITQANTGATGVVQSLSALHTYGIVLNDSAFNTISENVISGGEYGIASFGLNNRLMGNTIMNVTGFGITFSAHTEIINNRITTAPTSLAVQNLTNTTYYWYGNTYQGLLQGIAPQLDTGFTSQTEIDAIATKYVGLRVLNRSSGRFCVWNGTAWIYSGVERFISSQGGVADVRGVATSGLTIFGNTSANRPTIEDYGTILTLHSNNSDSTTANSGTWTNQLEFGNNFTLTWDQRINTYGTWRRTKVYTGQDFSFINTVATPTAIASVAAVGSTPTKAEYDTLLQDVTNIRTTLATFIANAKTSKILNS